MEDLYKTLGDAKCQELSSKYDTLSGIYGMAKGGRKSTQIGGIVPEGLARDFIREFLPAGFKIKGGLIFDAETKELSRQIDAIIYRGVPLLEFTDVVITEKNQVQAILETKSWIDKTLLFGEKDKETKERISLSGLFKQFEERKPFIPASAKYILFTFTLDSKERNDKVIDRLRQVCDIYAIVRRKKVGIGWKNPMPLILTLITPCRD